MAAHDQAIRLDPGNAMAHGNRGAALHSLGRYQEALDAYNQAIRLDPEHSSWARKARMITLHRLGRDHDAQESPG